MSNDHVDRHRGADCPVRCLGDQSLQHVLFVLAVIGVVLAVNGAVILGGSAVKMAKLRDGGSVVAEMMGGRRISPATTSIPVPCTA